MSQQQPPPSPCKHRFVFLSFTLAGHGRFVHGSAKATTTRPQQGCQCTHRGRGRHCAPTSVTRARRRTPYRPAEGSRCACSSNSDTTHRKRIDKPAKCRALHGDSGAGGSEREKRGKMMSTTLHRVAPQSPGPGPTPSLLGAPPVARPERRESSPRQET